MIIHDLRLHELPAWTISGSSHAKTGLADYRKQKVIDQGFPANSSLIAHPLHCEILTNSPSRRHFGQLAFSQQVAQSGLARSYRPISPG
jgi:hypothetical protein